MSLDDREVEVEGSHGAYWVPVPEVALVTIQYNTIHKLGVEGVSDAYFRCAQSSDRVAVQNASSAADSILSSWSPGVWSLLLSVRWRLGTRVPQVFKKNNC